MKKILSYSLIFISILFFHVFDVDAMSNRYDVNNDSVLDSIDAQLTLRKAENMDMNGTNWISSSISGDVNCDGSITSDDAHLLLRKSLDLDMSLTSWCYDNYEISITKLSDGDEAGSSVKFKISVSPSNDSSLPIIGNIAYSGTATEGIDYQNEPTTFSIPSGSDSTTISFDIIDDQIAEGNETIIATISDISFGTITTGNASAFINDNENGNKKIFIIGDSTVRKHNVSWDNHQCSAYNTENTFKGWGDSIGARLTHPENAINRARQGAAAIKFLDGPPGTSEDEVYREFADQSTPLNRYWAPTESDLSNYPNNAFLLIQFGSANETNYYNTACNGDPRGVDTCTEQDFKDAVRFYINRARALNVTPILVTVPDSRTKNADGTLIDTRGAFPGYIRDLASEENVQLLDLHAKSMQEFSKYSSQKLGEVFGQCVHNPGQNNEWEDVTHFEPKGADIVGGWIKELACQLSDKDLCNQFDRTNDTVIPEISLNGDYTITLQKGDTFVDPGAIAQDDFDGDISANIVVSGNVDTNTPGIYELKYNVTDNAGNQAIEVVRVVKVLSDVHVYEDAEDSDTKDWTVYAGDVGTISNIFDNSKGSRVIKLSGPNGTGDGFRYGSGNFFDESDKLILSWDLNFDSDYKFYVSVNTTDGDKIIYYEPTDDGDAIIGGRYKFSLGSSTKDGAWHTITRNLVDDVHSLDPNVDVLKIYRIAVRGSGMIDNIKTLKTLSSTGDNVAPVVLLNGNSVVTLSVGSTYSDSGASATDNVDGDISSDISTDNPVDTSVEGDYIVTYTVHDSSGNGAFAKRTVQVRDGMTMIEDAEDGDTVGWSSYLNNTGATITNEMDTDKNSRVMVFNGNGLDTGYKYDLVTPDSSHFVVSWRLKFNEAFRFMVKVKTTDNDTYYIEYTPDTLDKGYYTDTYEYVHSALGTQAQSGKWESFTRDLQADLHRFLPNKTISQVLGFRLRGSGRYDDISLSSRNSVSKFAFGGHTYEIVKNPLTWQNAKSDAESKNGYLANVGSKLENDEIYARLYEYIEQSEYSNTDSSDGGNASYVWIGGNDLDSEGMWLWDNTHMQFWSGTQTGNSVDYRFNNWGIGNDGTQHEPDNASEQDALAIALNEWTLNSGDLGKISQWNDLSTSNTLFYIVEYDD